MAGFSTSTVTNSSPSSPARGDFTAPRGWYFGAPEAILEGEAEGPREVEEAPR